MRERALRFDEDLVPFFVRKAHDLVLYRGAVARTRALYRAVIQGGAGDVRHYHVLGGLRGVGEVAFCRVVHPALRHKGEGIHVLALLRLHYGIIYRPPVQARGSARLKAAHVQPQRYEALREMGGVCKAGRSAFLAPFACYYVRIEVYARGYHDRFCLIRIAQSRPHSANGAAAREYLRGFCLKDVQILLLLQRALHGKVVFYLVRLRAQRVHRLALAAVEHTHLQVSRVRVYAHLPAQRVYLAHEVPLGGAAYRGIACHIRYGVGRERHHKRAQRSARQSKSRFNARMTAAYNYCIVTFFHTDILYHFIKKTRKHMRA